MPDPTGTYVIALEAVGARLLEIGASHSKCLVCHCYREVVDEATLLLEDSGAGRLGSAPVVARLRGLLAEREGSHG